MMIRVKQKTKGVASSFFTPCEESRSDPFVAFKPDDNTIWVWTFSLWFEPGPIPPEPDFKFPINAVEELEDGSMYLISTDLEFMKDSKLGKTRGCGDVLDKHHCSSWGDHHKGIYPLYNG
jgi:hypothetical protein